MVVVNNEDYFFRKNREMICAFSRFVCMYEKYKMV